MNNDNLVVSKQQKQKIKNSAVKSYILAFTFLLISILLLKLEDLTKIKIFGFISIIILIISIFLFIISGDLFRLSKNKR